MLAGVAWKISLGNSPGSEPGLGCRGGVWRGDVGGDMFKVTELREKPLGLAGAGGSACVGRTQRDTNISLWEKSVALGIKITI